MFALSYRRYLNPNFEDGRQQISVRLKDFNSTDTLHLRVISLQRFGRCLP